MKILKSLFRLLSSSFRQLLGNVSDVSAWLGELVNKPFSDLKRAMASRSSVGKAGGRRRQKLWLLPVTACLAVVSLVLKVLLSPLELLAAIVERKRKAILWSLVGTLALSGIVGGGIYAYTSSDYYSGAKITELKKLAKESYASGDFENAIELYQQLAASEDADNAEMFNLAASYSQSGDTRKASETLALIAPGPGNEPGYIKAHQTIAASIFQKIQSEGSNVEALQLLRWHLACSGNQLPVELKIVWAQYYLAIQDPEGAVAWLVEAASEKPQYLLLLANIYAQLGRNFERTESIRKAADEFETLLAADPTNVEIRINYSKILFDLDRVSQSEEVLLEGLKVNADSQLRRAIASFYVLRFKRGRQRASVDDETLLGLLRKAIEHDSGYLAAFESLIRFYRTNPVQETRTAILALLHDVVSKKDFGIAHLSLSSIYLLESETTKSNFHLQKAFEVDSSFAAIANNFAWMLAHEDVPDLERAYVIAAEVVKKNPNDGRFRDTLATILMKQQKSAQALVEFQQALPTANNRSEIHQKMASIYRELGKSELAVFHEEQADAN